MNAEKLEEIARKVALVSTEDEDYIGIYDKGQVQYAVEDNLANKLDSFINFIKMLNIGETRTVTMYGDINARVTSFTGEELIKIDSIIKTMVKAKEQNQGYQENELFIGMLRN